MLEEKFATPANGTDHWPVSLTLHAAERAVEVAFDDGRTFTIPAALLRQESPSAEVQGDGPGQRRIVPGAEFVGITALEPVGNYAVRIVFDDGHETGIYSWSYLYQLGQLTSSG